MSFVPASDRIPVRPERSSCADGRRPGWKSAVGRCLSDATHTRAAGRPAGRCSPWCSWSVWPWTPRPPCFRFRRWTWDEEGKPGHAAQASHAKRKVGDEAGGPPRAAGEGILVPWQPPACVGIVSHSTVFQSQAAQRALLFLALPLRILANLRPALRQPWRCVVQGVVVASVLDRAPWRASPPPPRLTPLCCLACLLCVRPTSRPGRTADTHAQAVHGGHLDRDSRDDAVLPGLDRNRGEHQHGDLRRGPAPATRPAPADAPRAQRPAPPTHPRPGSPRASCPHERRATHPTPPCPLSSCCRRGSW